MHWIAAVCIVLLIITGFYIGRPFFMAGSYPGVPSYAGSPLIMSWMRFLHFAAAGVLIATGIVRLYWLFAGNRFERWSALFPVKKRDWVNMWRMTKYYLMLDNRAPHYLGHHPMQQLTYTGIYVITALMVITGFALYGRSNPGGFFDVTFGWVNYLFGGIPMTRWVHHVLTWVYLIFIPMHIYLAMRAEIMERTGTISSIVSGGRWLPVDHKYEDAPPGSPLAHEGDPHHMEEHVGHR